MKSRKTQTRKRKHPIKEKGITLIALVITIVILLILSAVVIRLSLGEGGLADKAKEATENYQIAEQTEMDSIAEIENQIVSGDYGGGGRYWSEMMI